MMKFVRDVDLVLFSKRYFYIIRLGESLRDGSRRWKEGLHIDAAKNEFLEDPKKIKLGIHWN